MICPPSNLYELLVHAADISATRRDRWENHGITVYAPGRAHKFGKHVSYTDLLHRAQANTPLINKIPTINPDSIVLLHFDSHLPGIEWFWSVVVGGYIPVVSTPFVNDLEQRKRHLSHLKNLLNNPVVITTEALLPEFAGSKLNIYTVESLQKTYASTTPAKTFRGKSKRKEDIAALSLTSGSTGNAKAVALRHGQILAAARAKIDAHNLTGDDALLNWVGLDHVANLTETHITAMITGSSQVHVQAADILHDPLTFVRLIAQHSIAFTFAPNFFLGSLKAALESYLKANPDNVNRLDLSSLRALTCGGEAVVVATCKAVAEIFEKLGAGKHVIRPGFGMTETCAGCIFASEFPTYDFVRRHEFASLGRPYKSVDMRVTRENGTIAETGEIGGLELAGPVVFKEYFNNSIATAAAFTSDGWFITGDRALIDENGNLQLTGRAKETIIINGTKHVPEELETAINDAAIEGVTPSYTVVFPHRPKNHDTEVICICYLPSYESDNDAVRATANFEISQVALLQTGAQPHCIIPLPKELLPKSSLGKISRIKMRTAFEAGKFDTHRRDNEERIETFRTAQYEGPANDLEDLIMETAYELFDAPRGKFGVNTSLLQLGVTSIDVIQLKGVLQKKLQLETEIPTILILSNPTIRGMSQALQDLQSEKAYTPVVTLRATGKKTPLWLIHPGVGEVLVFLNLAKYITDRPVYALRARGFEPTETIFADIPDAVSTYHAAIKKRQPHGPYAIAGYSYGAMLAFEITKRLEANNDTVGFLGSFNLPPHIKTRMRQLDWIEVLLNLSYFLNLITDRYAHGISEEMHKLPKYEVVDYIIAHAEPTRMAELALDKEKLSKWADLALGLQGMAMQYEPSGTVACIDVFYAIPLSAVAKNKKEWLENQLSKWKDFSREPPRFTEVDGEHYTMISPEHVVSFQRKLKAVLRDRGL